jgi:uncharacterized membrane protein
MGFGGWGELMAAFAVFLAAHSIPARPAARARLVAMMGARAYLAVYATLSLVLLAWLIVAAGRAPYVELWAFSPWQMWAPNIAMPVAALLACFGFGAANPLSFGGRSEAAFDPEHPGIAGMARHPILWAFALWAGAHLLPNGDLAHVLLFGGFLAMALVGMAAIDRRKRRQLGESEWQRLTAHTSLVPAAALISGRWRPDIRRLSVRRFFVGLVAWLGLLVLHPIVIGVSPLPSF